MPTSRASGADAEHRAAVDADVAGIRLDDAGDQPQQHRLAGAGRAEDDDRLAALDRRARRRRSTCALAEALG